MMSLTTPCGNETKSDVRTLLGNERDFLASTRKAMEHKEKPGRIPERKLSVYHKLGSIAVVKIFYQINQILTEFKFAGVPQRNSRATVSYA